MLGNGQVGPDPKAASIVEQVGRFEDAQTFDGRK